MKPLNDNTSRRLIGVLCPYCGVEGFNAFAFYTRLFYRCNACGLIYRYRPDQDQAAAILSYYRHQYFDDYAGDQIMRKQSGFYRDILLLIERKIESGSILDVGCGCGYFLKEASDRQWAVSGIDPSQQSVDKAQRLIGDRVLCGTVDNLPPDRSYDAITLINVLDHMAAAFHDLEKIMGRLKKGGLLYIRVPNGFFHLSLLNLFKGLPGFISPYLVFHEYSFTGSFLTRCLADNGFTDIEVHCARLSGDDLYQQDGSISRFAKAMMIRVISGFMKSIEMISRGRRLLGPSIEVTAIKR